MKPRRLAPHPASTGRPCPPEPGGGRRWEVAGRSGGADPEPEARPSPERTASLWPPPATCAHIARTPSGAAGGRGAPTSTPPVRARGRGAPTSPPVRLPVALSATGNCLPWAHPSPSTLRSYFGVPPVSPAAGGMGTGPATVCALLPARLAELALNLVECGVFTTSLFRNTNALGSHTIVPV